MVTGNQFFFQRTRAEGVEKGDESGSFSQGVFDFFGVASRAVFFGLVAILGRKSHFEEIFFYRTEVSLGIGIVFTFGVGDVAEGSVEIVF